VDNLNREVAMGPDPVVLDSKRRLKEELSKKKPRPPKTVCEFAQEKRKPQKACIGCDKGCFEARAPTS
jgi:hypothetical protein